MQQAKHALKTWEQRGEMGTVNTQQDALTIALHVLTSAGYGVSYAFNSLKHEVTAGYSMTYGNALATVLKNLVLVYVAPEHLLTSPIVSANLHLIGRAVRDCRAYMAELINHERELIAKHEAGSGNLLSNLVRESDKVKTESLGSCRRGLEEHEIYGNLFLFSVAGHETTANTLCYCIMLLTAHPQYQDWVREELNHVVGNSSQEAWNYEDVYPKLTRCLALMVSQPK